jgi:hypothetical protein
MPALLSRYVRDNTGTVLMHRLTNLGSYEVVKTALGGHPLGNDFETEVDPLALRLPEDLAFFRRYLDPGTKSVALGITVVPRIK